MAPSRSKSAGKPRVYLVDGTSTLYRAFFAIRAGLTNKDGMPTNALYGFTNMLRKLLKEEQPEYLAVAFDRPEPTFRHKKYEQYKAQRPDTPPDLIAQAPWALKICRALGLMALEKPGYEADDILGTLAVQCRDAGFDVVVVASDKDLLQLVGDGIVVMNPNKELILDAHKVEEVFGVRPDQVVDVLALWGDASDNVPGVTGIGEKGAKQIIRDFGDLETAIARAEEIKRKSYRENLLAEADQARFSRELVTLDTDVPLDLEPEALRRSDPDGGRPWPCSRTWASARCWRSSCPSPRRRTRTTSPSSIWTSCAGGRSSCAPPDVSLWTPRARLWIRCAAGWWGCPSRTRQAAAGTCRWVITTWACRIRSRLRMRWRCCGRCWRTLRSRR